MGLYSKCPELAFNQWVAGSSPARLIQLNQLLTSGLRIALFFCTRFDTRDAYRLACLFVVFDGWAVAASMTAELVIDALKNAILCEGLPAGLIVHSDRGGQDVDAELRKLIEQHGFEQSMSRAEETYDNAFAESLFSRYKAELLEGGAFADVEQARLETFAFIE